jgi:hypothetical protein
MLVLRAELVEILASLGGSRDAAENLGGSGGACGSWMFRLAE